MEIFLVLYVVSGIIIAFVDESEEGSTNGSLVGLVLVNLLSAAITIPSGT